MSEDFKLESPESLPPARGGARPGAGRPKGRKNKRVSVLWHQARIASGNIQRQHIEEAERFQEYMRMGDLKRARIAFEAGEEILKHTWPEPRGAPVAVNIAQLGGAALVEAVQSGDLTPADAATLIRARSQVPNLIDVSPANGDNARQKLIERLTKVIEVQQAQPDPPAEAEWVQPSTSSSS